jgi:hypothetical protein
LPTVEAPSRFRRRRSIPGIFSSLTCTFIW